MSVASEACISVRADAGAMSVIRDFVGSFAHAHDIAGDDRARILIAIEELVTNLVKYGYADAPAPGLAEITLRLDGDGLGIEIVDDGQAFDPFAQPEPDLEASVEASPVGRLGLFLVKSLMDSADYRRVGDRNITAIGRRVRLRPERG